MSISSGVSLLLPFTLLLAWASSSEKMHAYDNYRPQRSWAKVIFSQASVCPQGGLPQCMVGYTPPPGSRHPPPPGADTSPDQTPHPRGNRHPPRPDPHPRKQTPAYGQRMAGTHPTGMHSCFVLRIILS